MSSSLPTTNTIMQQQQTVEEKLRELRNSLTPRPFRAQLVDSLEYLVRLEMPRQEKFVFNDSKTTTTMSKSASDGIDWNKLSYFPHQLKKMIKNKTHLDLLCSKMTSLSVSTSTTTTTTPKTNHLLDTTTVRNYSSLVNDGNYTERDYFALTNLLVRLVFKLIRSKSSSQTRPSPGAVPKSDSGGGFFSDEKLFDFVLTLISCLADLSLYEDMRAQLVNDSNLRCLFQIVTSEASGELDEKMKRKRQQQQQQQQQPPQTTTSKPISIPNDNKSLSLDALRKLWTKTCRLSANLLQDKHLHKVKHLIPNDFMPSLNKFLEQHLSHVNSSSTSQSTDNEDDNTLVIENNENNVDLYHSIVRLLKYAHELSIYKNQILKNRVLVFVCKYLNRVNKNLEVRVVDKSTATSNQEKSKSQSSDVPSTSKTSFTKPPTITSTTSTTDNNNNNNNTNKILVSRKYLSVVQDLVKQFLIVLDIWSQSFSTEFYNQMIEGNTIEHLVWLFVNQPSHLEPSKSPTPPTPMFTTTTTTTTTTSSSSSSKQEFKYFEFSLSLLMKFCHNYDACRSEFGRVGGLATCMSRIENTTTEKDDNNDNDNNYETLIEMVCMSCKTASNRVRLRDSGHLSTLVKLQQKLRSQHETTATTDHLSLAASRQNSSASFDAPSSNAAIDSTIYNRLLAALCCFVHDTDSMQTLYAQGLVDSLLFYLNESVRVARAANNSNNEQQSTNKATTNASASRLGRKLEIATTAIESKKISLRKLIFTEESFDYWDSKSKKLSSISSGKKRKSDTTGSSVASFSTTTTTSSSSKSRRIDSMSPPIVEQQAATTSNNSLTSPPWSSSSSSLLRHCSTSPSSLFVLDTTTNEQQQSAYHHQISTTASLHRRDSMSPTAESYASLSPTASSCLLYSPSFSISSSPSPPPPLATTNLRSMVNNNSNNNYYYSNLSPSGGSAYNAGLNLSPPSYLVDDYGSYSPPPQSAYSTSAPISNIQFSPTIREDITSSEEEEDEEDTEMNSNDENENNSDQDDQEICSIAQKCLPIEKQIIELAENNNNDNEEIDDNNDSQQATTTSLQRAYSDKDKDETSSLGGMSSTTAATTATENIESINRTEACVFYVLSQLSHANNNDTVNKSTSPVAAAAHATLVANFDRILVALLKYLKYAKVRNPRALRILNRLTKNPNYFRHFVLGLFPYQLKRILGGNARTTRVLTTTTTAASTTTAIAPSGSINVTTETEMNVYLHSNSAFFDASTSFPSFESIEFTLCNNLKSLCISSSDPGYSCLIGMMKQRSREEKLACSLVAPFVLRNSKALCYLMCELNGLELVLDTLFSSKTTTENESDSESDNDEDDNQRRKSFVCIGRILDFLAYKRDLKQIGESFEVSRARIALVSSSIDELDEQPGQQDDDLVDFVLVDDNSTVVTASKRRLARQSAYFEALLEGPLSAHLKRTPITGRSRIDLKNVTHDTLVILIDLLKCRPYFCDPHSSTSNHHRLIQDYKLTLDQCVKLAIASDCYLLADLRNFFLLTLAHRFLTVGSLFSLFKLATHLNCSFLACACVDFLLGLFLHGGVSWPTTTNDASSSLDVDTYNNLSSSNRLAELQQFFDLFMDDIQHDKNSQEEASASVDGIDSLDFLKRYLKIGLTEIIKNNSWRF